MAIYSKDCRGTIATKGVFHNSEADSHVLRIDVAAVPNFRNDSIHMTNLRHVAVSPILVRFVIFDHNVWALPVRLCPGSRPNHQINPPLVAVQDSHFGMIVEHFLDFNFGVKLMAMFTSSYISFQCPATVHHSGDQGGRREWWAE